MALPIKNIRKLHKSLEHNFLYNNDLNSMHLLLSMLENEVRLKKVRPKYICMSGIRRSITRTLLYRRDYHLIIRTLNKLINNDVNRLELSIYIDSYTAGYHDDAWADRIERYAINNLPASSLKDTTILFHEKTSPEINSMRQDLNDYLDAGNILNDRIKRFVFTYSEKIIKKKIYMINERLDEQLMISCTDGDKIVSEETFLTIPELTNIYQKVLSALVKNVIKIYRHSYWCGVNDRVLNRY